MSGCQWIYDDGGRSKAPGFGGRSAIGDCVPRAIAIATNISYAEVYEALAERQALYIETRRTRAAKTMRSRKNRTPRDGTLTDVWKQYLFDLGWTWCPTMTIGSGTTVHLRPDELPDGPILCRLSGHLVAVIDGVVHDTYDPSRNGTRAVYGFFEKGPG